MTVFEEHGILPLFGNRHAEPFVFNSGTAACRIGDLCQDKVAELKMALLQRQAQVEGKLIVFGFDLKTDTIVFQTELLVGIDVKIEVAVHQRKLPHERGIGVMGVLLRKYQDVPEIILAVKDQVREIFLHEGDVFGPHTAQYDIGRPQVFEVPAEQLRTQQSTILQREVIQPGMVFLFVEVDKEVFGPEDGAHLLFTIAFLEIEGGLHLRFKFLHMHPRKELLFVHGLEAQQQYDAGAKGI